MQRLRELERAYAGLPFALTYWREYQGTIPLDRFRDNFYLGAPTTRASWDYARSVDPDGLLGRLGEDNAFGAQPSVFDGHVVSRDLVDSFLELRFLRRHIGPAVERARILDVGAGYGRLAYRVSQLWPEAYTYSTDGVAVSTLVCETYLAHRQVARAEVVPAHELHRVPAVDVATNVHSWSECSYDAIAWWLDRIADRGARWLFVVPHRASPTEHRHPEPLLSCEAIGGNRPYRELVEARGFELVACEPKYPAGVEGFEPTSYYLFERRV